VTFLIIAPYKYSYLLTYLSKLNKSTTTIKQATSASLMHSCI